MKSELRRLGVGGARGAGLVFFCYECHERRDAAGAGETPRVGDVIGGEGVGSAFHDSDLLLSRT